jgi:peptidoglycan hydrolase-like protein with peptidoglycan-binding domain
VPKNIQASVGLGGRNLPQNVMMVQYLLNCVPASQAGPVPELAIDGIAGPKTVAAIRKFQQTRFGRADGRVDPGARTIATLAQYDPYPNLPLEAVLAHKAPSGAVKGPGTLGHKTPMSRAAPKTPGPAAGYKHASSSAPAKSTTGAKTPGGAGASWGKVPGKGGLGGKTF